MEIHQHPALQEKLKLDENHVIIDKEVFDEIEKFEINYYLWMNADCGCKVFKHKNKEKYIVFKNKDCNIHYEKQI